MYILKKAVTYNINCPLLLFQELSIFGFNVYKYADLFDGARDQLAEWIREGSLKPYEHVVEGFENMPKAFIDQMEGKSQGKVIVRV